MTLGKAWSSARDKVSTVTLPPELPKLHLRNYLPVKRSLLSIARSYILKECLVCIYIQSPIYLVFTSINLLHLLHSLS